MSRNNNYGGNDGSSVTKKVKQGPVEVDFEDSALVVHYEVETVEIDDRGAVRAVIDRKPEIRRIKIKSLSPDKNMAQLAADIVDKCKYIHPSRMEEIEQLLIKLRKHHVANAAKAGNAPAGPQKETQAVPPRYDDDDDSYEKSRADPRGRNSNTNTNNNSNRPPQGREQPREQREQPSEARPAKKEKKAPVDNLPPADMNELDDYLELLYQVSGKSDREKEEGLRVQERGTAMILKLCRDVMNLEQLIQNSTVMGAITRVLQEEYKKSIDLTFNILRIFLAFSNFTEMHNLMANYKIGVLTMKAIEFEVKRIEIRDAEHQHRDAEYQAELQQIKDNYQHGDPKEYQQLVDKLRKQKDKELAKQVVFDRKQDKILFVGFYILLNLAEDVSVEKKMVKKGLIPLLIAIVNHRKFEDLLILIMTFLKKLSVFEENKDHIREQNLILKLLQFLTCSSAPLINISLRLLFNLSFDTEIRNQMVKAGYIPKLIALLKVPSYRAKTLKLLYHLSVDDRCKAMIHYTEGINILMGMVINFPQDTLAKELAALMVNLSYNPKNIEQMISNKGLNLLMDRMAEKRDPLLMKIIRNISLWSFHVQEELGDQVEMQYKYRGLWSPHIKTLLEIVLEENSHDVVVEVVGCLANMTVNDLSATSNWSKLLRDYNLVAFLTKMLIPGIAQNDLILEIVMLISTIATDQAACNILATGNLITTIYQVFKEKGEDVEIALQCLNCFHKLMFTQASLETVMYSTRIFSDIIECLTHRSTAIRSKAEVMSEIVLEYDRKPTGELGQLGKQVLKKRFESYNKVWLANQAESGGAQYGGMMPDGHDEGGYYDQMDYDGEGPGRMLSAHEQEVDMLTSAKYFNEKIDNSMMDWNMNSKIDDSLDYGPRYMQSEIDSWNGGGGVGYK